MITEVEIGKLKTLVQKLEIRYRSVKRNIFIRVFSLEDFLQDEDIEVIKENSTQYENLRNRVIVPLHKKKVFKKLVG